MKRITLRVDCIPQTRHDMRIPTTFGMSIYFDAMELTTAEYSYMGMGLYWYPPNAAYEGFHFTEGDQKSIKNII